MSARPQLFCARWRIVMQGFFWLVVLAYFAALAINVLCLEGRFSPDSVIYLDTARNLLAGNGLSSTLAPLDAALRDGVTLPAPMTAYGPLYPLLIALLARLGVGLNAAALAISVLFLLATLFAAFLLLRHAHDGPAALLGIAFLMQCPALRRVSAIAWSETATLAFMVLFFWLADEPDCRPRRAAATGLVAGLALATRYALLPLFLIGVVAHFGRNGQQRTKRYVCLVAGFLLVAGPLILRNWLRAGKPLGDHIPRVHFRPGEVCVALLRILAKGMAPAAPFASLLLILLMVGTLLMAYQRFRRKELYGLLRRVVQGRSTRLLLLWAVIYSGLLVSSEVRYAIDPIDERLVLPASVALVLIAAALVAGMLSPKQWITVTFACLLAVCALAPEITLARIFMHSRVSFASVFTVERSPYCQWVSDNVGRKDLLIAENSFFLPLYFGPVRMLYFESQLPTMKPLRYEDIMEYVVKHRGDACAYLALRAGLNYSAPRDPLWGSFLSDLEAGRIRPYPAITKVADLDDAHVWRIDQVSGERAGRP